MVCFNLTKIIKFSLKSQKLVFQSDISLTSLSHEQSSAEQSNHSIQVSIQPDVHLIHIAFDFLVTSVDSRPRDRHDEPKVKRELQKYGDEDDFF